MNLLAMHNLNEQLFLFINGGAGYYGFLDYFFLFVTYYLVPLMVGFTILYFFIVLPKRSQDGVVRLQALKKALLLAISLVFVWAIVELIKGIVVLPRPWQVITDLQTLSTFGNNDSFPSAHSALAFTVATFIYHYYKPAGVVAFSLAIFVGLSRIFVGVHYPIDVFFGALIGIVIPWGIISIFKPYR
jgi:undecaprenyl-diphosphatase